MTSSMPLTYSILRLYNLNCKQYTKYKHKKTEYEHLLRTKFWEIDKKV